MALTRTCCSPGGGDIWPISKLDIPVVLLSDTPKEVIASAPTEVQVQSAKPVPSVGTIEIRIGRAVVKVDGPVDADMLRIVLGSLRS